jgi:hypothetical protein
MDNTIDTHMGINIGYPNCLMCVVEFGIKLTKIYHRRFGLNVKYASQRT